MTGAFRRVGQEGIEAVGRQGSKLIQRLLGQVDVPPNIQAAQGILRNALSNAPEVTDDIARNLRLGPAQSRIARESLGDVALSGRGGNLSVVPSRVPARAPRPEFDVPAGSPTRGFTGSSAEEITRSIPVRDPVRPTSMPRSVRPGAAQPQAPVPDFAAGGPTGARPIRMSGETRTPGNVAPRPEFPNDVTPPQSSSNLRSALPQRNPEFRPTGTTDDATQLSLQLRNPAGTQASRTTVSSAGRTVPEGTNIGGRMYNPAAAASRGANRQIRGMANDGGRLVDLPDAPGRIPNGQLSALDDFARARYFQNAGGTPISATTNLSDPAVRAMIAAGATGLGIAAGVPIVQGVADMSQGELDRVQGQMPMTGVADEVPSVVSSVVSQVANPLNNALARITEVDPSPIVIQDGATPTNTGYQEERRAAIQQSDPVAAAVERNTEPMSPEKYSNIEDYYAARDAYARQEPQKNLLSLAAGALQQERQTQADLESWAAANPELMYELQRRAMINPAMSQQTPSSVVTSEAGSALGTNPAESAEIFASAVGSPELSSASAPFQQPKLENLPLQIQRRLAAF